MLHELLATLLQAVIIAAIPILTIYAVKCLNSKATQAASQTDNKKSQTYIAEAAEAVSTAVAYTSQTYVDALKNSDAFTAENQQEALQKAKEKAIELISKSASDFLNNVYGDVGTYIEAKIEQAVRVQKGDGIFALASAIDINE